MLQKHLMVEAPPVPPELVAGVNVPIAAIVAKLLAKEPAERYQSATDLLAAIDGISPRAPAVAAVRDEAEPIAKAKTQAAASEAETTYPVRARLFVGLGSLGVLVLVVVVMAILFTRTTPPKTAEADAAESATPSLAESTAALPVSQPPTVIVSPSADLPEEEDAGAPAAVASGSAPPIRSKRRPNPSRSGRKTGRSRSGSTSLRPIPGSSSHRAERARIRHRYEK